MSDLRDLDNVRQKVSHQNFDGYHILHGIQTSLCGCQTIRSLCYGFSFVFCMVIGKSHVPSDNELSLSTHLLVSLSRQ